MICLVLLHISREMPYDLFSSPSLSALTDDLKNAFKFD